MFLDDDNDKIAVSTDSELGLAWKEIKEAGKVVLHSSTQDNNEVKNIFRIKVKFEWI